MTLPSGLRLPLGLGLAMGLMMPWMLHAQGGWGAVWFVLAHAAALAVLAGIGLLALRLPRLAALARRLRGAHRPGPGHVAAMGGGIALGWGLTCALCVALYVAA